MHKPERARAPIPAAFTRFISGLPVPWVAFSGLCFLYVWLRIEPAVEYQRFSLPFFLRASFFAEFLARPGGLAEYTAAFLGQLNVFSWLGALVYTVLCGALYFLLRAVVWKISGERLSLVPLVIPFLVLALRGRYSASTLLLMIGVIVSLGFGLGAMSSSCSRGFARVVVCWLAAPVVFYLAGLWALVTYALLFCLGELLRWKSPARAVLGFASVGVGPLWLFGSSDLGLDQVWNPWGKGPALVVAAVAYAFPPAAAVVAALYRRVHPAIAVEQEGHRLKSHHGSKGASAKRSFPWRQSPWAQATVFTAAWIAVWLAFDASAKTRAQIEYFVATGQFAKVPPLASRLSRSELDPPTELRLQYALYRTGRLCEDSFSFRNQTGWNVLPGLAFGLETCRPQSEVLFDLGLVSNAEHYAHEALELEGDRPDVLRLLARINLVKERPQAARVFLTALSQVPFQGEWARARLDALGAGEPLAGCRELDRVRSCMLTNDLPHDAMPAEPLLRQLLYRNHGNRMAFEYLMAHYLMNLQMDKIAEALPVLEFFGDKQIPRHLEEAALLHQKLAKKPLDLRGRSIRPETAQRFERFAAALQQKLHETEQGRAQLTRDFGDTFWYFYLARRSQ